jgi:pimeloyl-ACP methyl ester carboxylesterase
VEPLIEHRPTLAGCATRALELEGAGPPHLLLHGWADSADTWRLVLDRFARAGRRALAIDLPGFGAADPLRRSPVLPQIDRVVAAARAELGEPAIVVGNSLGACAALRLAERSPDEVLGVVAVAPAGLAMAPWFGLVERDPLLRSLLAVPSPVPGRVTEEIVGRVYRALAFAHPGRVDGKLVRAFTAHHRDRAAIRRYLDTARRMLPELRDPFELERIRCPVLLVWGERDRMVFPRGADRVLAEIPDSRLEVIPDCGHCPQIEAPERLIDLLDGFADGILAPR